MKKAGSSPVAKGRRREAPPPSTPFRFDSVSETSIRFNLPLTKITEFRSLAKQDPETDPWIGDFTFPDEFQRWLWGKRRDLEKIQRQRDAHT